MTVSQPNGNDYVGRIYEAAILPERWPNVLQEMAVSVEGAFASLFTFDGSVVRWTGTPEAIGVIDAYKAYERTAPNRRMERGIQKGWPGFITDRDVFDDDEMDADPFYRDFMRPRGYGWTVGSYFQLATGDSLILSAERAYSRGPVEPRFVAHLDSLRPHFARSALLSARLRLERAAAMNRALETIGLPSSLSD